MAGAVVAAMHAAAGFYLYSLPGAPSGPSAPAIVQFKLEPMVVQADAPSQSQAQGSEGQDAPKRVESTVVAPEAAVPETTPVLEAVNDAPAQPEIVDEPIEPAIAVPAPDRLEGVPPELRQDTAIPVPTIEATDPAADPAILPDALEAEALAPEIAEEQPESIVTVPLPPRLEGVPSQLQATMPPAKPTPRVAPPAEAKPPASKPRVERMTRLQKAAKPEAKLERARTLGADGGVNYKDAKWVDKARELSGGEGVDVVIDGVGGPTYDHCIDLLRPGGR
ncbi:MAG: zinc-binding dehydrogenase, partial [Mesorhizobium sp.]|nr:zinc-binding dehydrogenase [Mesorhizobium sp.]